MHDLPLFSDTFKVTTRAQKKGQPSSTQALANPTIKMDVEDNETIEDRREYLEDTDVIGLKQLQDLTTPVRPKTSEAPIPLTGREIVETQCCFDALFHTFSF